MAWRVLLVEDDPLMRELLSMYVGRSSFFEIVGVADDAESALRVAQAVSPDVVLLDLFLPGSSGFEVLPILRANVAHARVVMVSMLQREGTEAKAVAAGAVGLVDKGLDAGALVQRLVDLVGRPLEVHAAQSAPRATAKPKA